MLVIFPGDHLHELAGDVKGSNYSLSMLVPEMRKEVTTLSPCWFREMQALALSPGVFKFHYIMGYFSATNLNIYVRMPREFRDA